MNALRFHGPAFFPAWVVGVVGVVAGLGLAGCGDEPRVGAVPEVAAPVGSGVDDGLVRERGAAVVAEALALLGGNLQAAMAEGGPVHAVQFCSEKALELAASVRPGEGVEVRRVSHRARNPENRATLTELDVLDGFAEALREGRETPPVVRAEPGGPAVFYAPITVFSPVCLRCHGEVGSDIDDATAAEIGKLYPEDRATGFGSGDLRGMWAIRFLDVDAGAPPAIPGH